MAHRGLLGRAAGLPRFSGLTVGHRGAVEYFQAEGRRFETGRPLFVRYDPVVGYGGVF